ncbi:MAG: site-specific integrase [Candidatus Margulisiibacteriota bacterium]
MIIRIKTTAHGLTFHLVEEVAGKQTSRKTPARTLTEAKEYMYQAQGERTAGKPVSLFLKDIPFPKLVTEYKEYSLSRKAESTYKKDDSVIKALLAGLRTLKIGQITTTVIQRLQSIWSRDGKSNKTINNRSILLGTMLRFAIESGYLATLPKITKLKVDLRRPQWYTEAERKKILEVASPEVKDYVIVLLNSGLRLGELQRLKWADIDFSNKQINVEKSKSHRFRIVPMHDLLHRHLLGLFIQKAENQIFVFESKAGKPMNSSQYYRHFKMLLDKLGIEGNVHKLRHTFASLLVQRGVPIYEVQHLLGHASVQTTQVYAHINQQNLKRAVDVLQKTGTEPGRNEKILLGSE